MHHGARSIPTIMTTIHPSLCNLPMSVQEVCGTNSVNQLRLKAPKFNLVPAALLKHQRRGLDSTQTSSYSRQISTNPDSVL